jgi:hypothetical protein
MTALTELHLTYMREVIRFPRLGNPLLGDAMAVHSKY